jgi:hypothetical protein
MSPTYLLSAPCFCIVPHRAHMDNGPPFIYCYLFNYTFRKFSKYPYSYHLTHSTGLIFQSISSILVSMHIILLLQCCIKTVYTFLFFFFPVVGVKLRASRQVLYHLSHVPNPFTFSLCFFVGGFLFVCFQMGSH